VEATMTGREVARAISSMTGLRLAPVAAVPEISVIVPVHNEADNIAELSAEIVSALRGQASFEIVFVDDGSTDATAAELVRVAAVHPEVRPISHDRKSGQSIAVASGVMAARGRTIVTIDGDGQNDPAFILPLARKLATGQPGIGLVAGRRVGRKASRFKRLQSRIANAVRGAILRDGTTDTGCGLKAVPRDLFLRLPVFDALHRFLDMGIEAFLIASSVVGVIGQRLLRRVCDSCKEPYRPPSEQVRLVAAQIGTGAATFAKGGGCNQCQGTGYRGRIGVYELLTVSDQLREMIVDKATHAAMRKVAVDEGMRTMQFEAFNLVARGITTVEEVIRSVYAPGIDMEGAAEVAGELMAPKKALPPVEPGEIERREDYAPEQGDGPIVLVPPTGDDDDAEVAEPPPAPWEVGA